MRRCTRLLLSAVLGGAVAGAAAQDPFVADTSAQAFEHALPSAEPASAAFLRGRSLFRRAWVVGTASDGDGRGLGPLFNRLSCVACHPGNGRGRAPDGPDERLQSMLVRVSMPGPGPHGGPRPHAAYGDQINEDGVRGVPGEGRVQITWVDHLHRLADGSTAWLRRPRVALAEPGYGPPPAAMRWSPRVGTAVYGLGLLQDVSDDTLRELARQAKADGVRGRLNQVWDPVSRRQAIGRFGWKANSAGLRAQVVQAALGDLGLTSDTLPAAHCAPRQAACRQAAQGQGVELDRRAVDDLVDYLQHLAPPAPRGAGSPTLEQGRRLFTQAGCAVCHRDDLPAGPQRQPLAAYTDLLLHDMGPGLSDGRRDFRAGPRDWRTPPLWGIGLVPVVNEHSQYLHDGRARNLREAVLWHGGEATPARQRFERLGAAAQRALLAFVESL